MEGGQSPILRTVGLKKYFGEVRAVDGVDFAISPGEAVAMVGPNGAGKTTFVNVITGYYMPDGGKIYFDGKDITHHSRIKKIKLGIARSFQLVNLYEQLTCLDNLRVAILSRERISHVFWKTLDSYRNVTEEAFQVLETFGLKDKANVLASELPGGMRKLLDVAVAYALNPKVLLLDEPTSGVASREKHDIMKIIVKAVKDKRIASLIIEHDMEIVYNYSDRAVVFFGGKIIAEGKPEEVLENAEVQEKILGVKE
jgi:branched-chain amino acid transport system ATP-binding protein